MSKMGSKKPIMDRNSWRIVKLDIANPVNAIKGRKKTKFQWKPVASPP